MPPTIQSVLVGNVHAIALKNTQTSLNLTVPAPYIRKNGTIGIPRFSTYGQALVQDGNKFSDGYVWIKDTGGFDLGEFRAVSPNNKGAIHLLVAV